MQITLTCKEGQIIRVAPPSLTVASGLTVALTWTSTNGNLVSAVSDAASPLATLTIGNLPSGMAVSGAIVNASGNLGNALTNDNILVQVQRAGPGS